jgi:hypothetical protein
MTSLAFIPQKPWMYCLRTSEEGDNHSYIPPETGQWADLVATSQVDVGMTAPSLLVERPLLLALWCLVTPQRALTPVICHLYEAFSEPAKELAEESITVATPGEQAGAEPRRARPTPKEAD